LGSGTALELVSAGKQAPNWAVESVTAPAHVYDPKQTRVVATVAGWQTPAVSRKVSLVLDGKVASSKEVNVPANGRAQVEFLSFDVPYGMHRGEIRIEPHDVLTNDDSFSFATERSDPRKVLFLYAGGRNRSSFYYRAAMDSASETGLTVQPEPVEQANGETFSNYAFVVLEDAGSMPETLERKLGDYVRGGGALLVTVGPATMRSGRVPVTGLHFTEIRETLSAGSADNDHPALRGAGQFDNVQFFDIGRFTDPKDAHILVKLSDGSPLLLQQDFGEGRVLTFASAFDNATNDFPLHTSFVPFVAQTGRYLAGSEDIASSAVVGSAIELRRARDKQGSSADVIGPDGKHELSLREASSAGAFELNREGFYEIRRADGRRTLVAANADRRESDLTVIPEETLALWRNTGKTTPVTAGVNEEQTRQWSLWRYALLLFLIAAAAESVVAGRYLVSIQRQ
jgi:hypothetical protein